MRKIALCVTMLISICLSPWSEAGLFDNEVDMADLYQLPAESLNTLKDTEFEVFVAEVKLAGAKVSENRAKEDLKKAKSQLDTKRLELKAAKAKDKEASETSAGKRAQEAQAALKSTQEQYDITELLVKWKKKELDVKTAGVDKAKAAVSVAEANREIARAMRIVESKLPTAGRYNIDDFKKDLAKRKKEYDKKVALERKKMIDVATLKAEYEKAVKP